MWITLKISSFCQALLSSLTTLWPWGCSAVHHQHRSHVPLRPSTKQLPINRTAFGRGNLPPCSQRSTRPYLIVTTDLCTEGNSDFGFNFRLKKILSSYDLCPETSQESQGHRWRNDGNSFGKSNERKKKTKTKKLPLIQATQWIVSGGRLKCRVF